MRPNIEFGECLKDSPRFRASLEDAENDVDLLEAKLEKLVKLCNGMIESGKVFNNANSAFIGGVREVSEYFKEDDLVSDALSRFTHCLAEMQKYHTILLDQAHRSICKNLNNFVKNDVKKVKETRRHFEKISDDMDNALMKNAQAPKSKPQDCEDANNVLHAMDKCFQHTSLDYVFQINILHSKKRFDVLDTMMSYMRAQNTYFHQGFDLFEDLEHYMKQVSVQVEELSTKAAQERKEMEERHTLVQMKKELPPSSEVNAEHDDVADIKMEGYLFKRTSNAFKSWVRRWFMIQNNQLVYRKRSKDNITIMEEDLRLCTVKPAYEIDRRFCFEVVSPTRSHMLQGDSEEICQSWINAIQAGVTNAYRNANSDEDSDSHNSDSKSAASQDSVIDQTTLKNTAAAKGGSVIAQKLSRMEQILKIPGNSRCADCGSSEPRWASINIGITLCIECSGIHRGFGVHMSKVRSVTLDAWDPDLIKVMLELGNTYVNKVYEANVDEAIAVRATTHCNRAIREAWIKAKYIQRAFVRKLPLEAEQNNDTTGNSIKPKKWSVVKRKRRSPSKSDVSTPENQDHPPIPEGVTMIQGASQDSGLGGSTPDVIVFGAEQEITRSSDIPVLDSEDSASDIEGDPDNRSTTSFEEFSKLNPDLLLFRAAQARNLPVMMEALAQGANPNMQNDKEDGKTPLIMAIETGSMVPVEFLLLNGAKVDKRDSRGRSALHHATIHGHTGQVCQLLKRNANQHAVDEDGMDPLMIAINNANADIVTLLRLAKLNEEMKESEGFYGLQGDETFNEVFKDFTNMANNTPEKLNRKK